MENIRGFIWWNFYCAFLALRIRLPSIFKLICYFMIQVWNFSETAKMLDILKIEN
jgi:hypothetical protein